MRLGVCSFGRDVVMVGWQSCGFSFLLVMGRGTDCAGKCACAIFGLALLWPEVELQPSKASTAKGLEVSSRFPNALLRNKYDIYQERQLPP